jgi:hypothetical protein
MAPSSSLLQGKHLPFSPSSLRLNIFRLFEILSLTQLYRYTPEIFLFTTATFRTSACEINLHSVALFTIFMMIIERNFVEHALCTENFAHDSKIREHTDVNLHLFFLFFF